MTRKITFLKAEATIEMCPKDTPTVMQLNVGGFNTYCCEYDEYQMFCEKITLLSNLGWEDYLFL